MNLYLKNTLSGLVPIYGQDIEEKRKLKLNEIYQAKVVMPRNVYFHRKFFALLNLAYENLPEGHYILINENKLIIRNVNHLLYLIKMQTGYFDLEITLDGQVERKAKSISFAKMNEASFQEFYNKALQCIIDFFLPGTTSDEIEEAVLNFL